MFVYDERTKKAVPQFYEQPSEIKVPEATLGPLEVPPSTVETPIGPLKIPKITVAPPLALKGLLTSQPRTVEGVMRTPIAPPVRPDTSTSELEALTKMYGGDTKKALDELQRRQVERIKAGRGATEERPISAREQQAAFEHAARTLALLKRPAYAVFWDEETKSVVPPRGDADPATKALYEQFRNDLFAEQERILGRTRTRGGADRFNLFPEE
jgi:hypothetical protein